MWKLKECARCRGDVFVEQYEHGWYKQCLRCGYYTELPCVIKPKRQPFMDQKELTIAGNR